MLNTKKTTYNRANINNEIIIIESDDTDLTIGKKRANDNLTTTNSLKMIKLNQAEDFNSEFKILAGKLNNEIKKNQTEILKFNNLQSNLNNTISNFNLSLERERFLREENAKLKSNLNSIITNYNLAVDSEKHLREENAKLKLNLNSIITNYNVAIENKSERHLREENAKLKSNLAEVSLRQELTIEINKTLEERIENLEEQLRIKNSPIISESQSTLDSTLLNDILSADLCSDFDFKGLLYGYDQQISEKEENISQDNDSRDIATLLAKR